MGPKPDTFARFLKNEAETPSPRKELLDRTIYLSSNMNVSAHRPCVSDSSEARFGNSDSPQHTDLIMPAPYRAPEVILEQAWSFPVDRWSFAMAVSLHCLTCLLRR